MKRNIFLIKMWVLGFLFVSMVSNAQRITDRGYLITANIKGINSGVIKMYADRVEIASDSAIIRNGRFTMMGKIGSPQRMLFSITPGNWNFRAFIENADISLAIDTVNAEYHDGGNDKWALIWEISESGSELADVYSKYIVETQRNYYSTTIKSLWDKLKQIEPGSIKEEIISHQVDSITKVILEVQRNWIEKYTKEYPTSVAGVYIFYEYYKELPDANLPYLESIFNRFTGIATSTTYYKELADIVNNLKKLRPR